MPETFLHGVQVLEVDTGARPIRTVRSSVIGVVGSGNSDGVQASAEVGATNSGIKYTAVPEGAAGNGISIVITKPAGNNAALAVTVAGNTVAIALATDGSAVATSTAAQVIAAVNGSLAASALVTASLRAESNGSGLVAVGTVTLSGAVAPTFPLNRPVLVTSPRNIDAQLGADTYLGKALEAIYTQAGAVCVVVRTNDVGGDATDLTGVFALKRAQADLGYVPRILITEGAGDADPATITAFKAVAESLRAVIVVNTEAASDTDATGWVEDNGNDRVYTIWPSINGGEDPAPNIAGLIAKSDNERGFWWSPSNQEVFGVTSLDQPIDFQLGDTTCLANVLNEGKVATFIRQGGFRLWGNLTGSIDAKWAFLSVRRTADIINDSILAAHLWAVDRNITKTYLEDVTASVNGYLATLVNLGAILGGRCWPDPDLNSPANIALGKVYFNFEFTPPYPAQTVTFRSILTNDYLSELV